MASLFKKMRDALTRTSQAIGRTVDAVRGLRLDDAFFDQLEEDLILADAGVAMATAVVERLRSRSVQEREYDADQVRAMLAEIITELLAIKDNTPQQGLTAIMLLGVNGVGKTTTAGKLCHRMTQSGQKVVVAAADTFRAAAQEQLDTWVERAGGQLVAHQPGADPAAVFFDAIAAAKARNADVVLCDTAGRLHNKTHLMAELQKISRIADREGIPCLRLLVVDGATGQNAVSQARAFTEACGVDGIVITKLDGTAKGGVVLSLAGELGLPVYYVGIGEGIDDLYEFDAEAYAAGLVGLAAAE